MAESTPPQEEKPNPLSPPHLTLRESWDVLPYVRKRSLSLKGEWEDLMDIAEKIKLGYVDPELANTLKKSEVTLEADREFFSACNLTRTPAGRGELTFQVAKSDNIESWALDFQTVSKNILTWHADAEEDKDKPDLEKIKTWQSLEKTNVAAYNNYQYSNDSNDKLENASLELAKMIREDGITSYMIHAPVLTRTMISTNAEEIFNWIGNHIDKICDIKTYYSVEIGQNQTGQKFSSYMAGLANAWLCSSARAVVNVDGTITSVVQWIGADSINDKLYDTAEDGGGGESAGAGGGTSATT